MDELNRNLRDHVIALSNDIGERNFVHHEKLEAAADYILDRFEGYGYKPETQDYYLDGKRFRNIIALNKGQCASGQIVIVGAHYDTVLGSPGADDNASAVAGLLELARLFSKIKTARIIKFIAFTNEEHPFFETGDMGSMVYARWAREKKEDVIANFIAVCGNLHSRGLVRKIKQEFKEHSQFGIESVVGPVFLVPGIDFSDNSSFWHEGYRAVMVTDTAFYRNPNYHGPEDTFETLNYESMAEVVKGLYNVLIELAGSEG